VGDPPLEQRPSTTAELLLEASFGLAEVTRVRHQIEVVSRRRGLDDDTVEDWIIAVNELMINVIRHGGGRGTVRLLLLAGRFTCEVADCGPGFDTAHYLARTERPRLSGAGGMGLWMVGQMTESLLINSGPAGTTIYVSPRRHNIVG
jgi:anti-sigma regulatory factor (Ser/Thr protein kinase)